MKNINKNLIKKYTLGFGIALTILAILAIGVFSLPSKTHAYVTYTAGYVSGYNAPNLNRGNEINTYHATSYSAPITPIYETQPIIYKTQPVVYQTQPRVEYVNQNTNYSNPPQATTSTTSVSNSDTSYKTSSTGITSADYSNLTANSLFGRFSFMPSGLMQWILLGIFILVIVILIRKVMGKDTEYYSTPLKHA